MEKKRGIIVFSKNLPNKLKYNVLGDFIMGGRQAFDTKYSSKNYTNVKIKENFIICILDRTGNSLLLLSDTPFTFPFRIVPRKLFRSCCRSSTSTSSSNCRTI